MALLEGRLVSCPMFLDSVPFPAGNFNPEGQLKRTGLET